MIYFTLIHIVPSTGKIIPYGQVCILESGLMTVMKPEEKRFYD